MLLFRNKNPASIAVIHEQYTTTYAELEQLADNFARYLQHHGVQEGCAVALCMRRSAETLAAVWACWKLGAFYVPLDPETPLARIKQIFLEAQPRCIVTEAALLEKISDISLPVLTFSDPAYYVIQKVVAPVVEWCSDLKHQLAYLIYTSGSTGTPKGVMVSHANLKNHIDWLIDTFQITHLDTVSFNSPFSFDFSLTCTVGPLAAGAKILITSEWDTLNLEAYCQQLITHQVTFVKWTPSYFKLLVEYVEKHRPDFSLLRYVMVAGEELLTSYAQRWFNVYPSHSIINEYGPTETTIGITTAVITAETLNSMYPTVPIGKAVNNTELYVLNEQGILCKKGEEGELFIGGMSVAIGYYKRPDLTAERFIDNPFVSADPHKLYKTGDLVKQLPDGSYLYLGRIDRQIKQDGYRIELHEIEARLLQYVAIQQVVVAVDKRHAGEPVLVAYVVLKESYCLHPSEIRNYLAAYFSHYMIPKHYYEISTVPLTPNGKVDYFKLIHFSSKEPEKEADRKEKEAVWTTTSFWLPRIIQSVKQIVDIDQMDSQRSFFSLGVTSLLAIRLVEDLNQRHNTALRISDIFLYSTPLSLAQFLEQIDHQRSACLNSTQPHQSPMCEPIAIIAMECRYPGANNSEDLWDIIREGRETVDFFEAGPGMVGARGSIHQMEYFDADFFHYSPKEAHLTDPQHRLWIECAWTALEKAGYAPGSKELGQVGVYASMNESTYAADQGLVQRAQSHFPDTFSLLRLLSSQFLATKVAYQLNCTGPAMTLQTACSSSLVAVALACQQLSANACDIALAGGISITTPQNKPYAYQPGNIYSPDGHCRPFDREAQGTVFSNGLGIVVLKRLRDAIHDGDTIVSVIKGFAINNDGHDKMSYLAPSITGQIECIAAAQTASGITADSIQYVEAHGTATTVGDPIEIEALTKAFRNTTRQQQFCALGSLKGNIGHTHVAAGVAGLIKTALVLQHGELPPTVNYHTANPHIDFVHSPFYVNTRLQKWPRSPSPRRAAVSAFGVGGTNAHLILEEPPAQQPGTRQHSSHLLLLSAKTEPALRMYQDQLITYLDQHAAVSADSPLLADIAYTLQVGRHAYSYRSSVVAETIPEAILYWKAEKNKSAHMIKEGTEQEPWCVFLFPGQGTQYINSSKALYQDQIVYRQQLDACFSIGSHYSGVNLKNILFPDRGDNKDQDFSLLLDQTEWTHPILFSIEYALAQYLIHLGIRPQLMIGHSLGEYVAACLSGVFTLEEAIRLVCARGKAIAQCTPGALLIVPLPVAEALRYAPPDLSVAAINAPASTVFSGSVISIKMFEENLAPILNTQSLVARRLPGNAAFHSSLLESGVSLFQKTLESITFHAPTIPYFSNVTGKIITAEQVQRVDYWITHMLTTVRFSEAAYEVVKNPVAIFIEVGLGRGLLSLLQKHTPCLLNTVSLLPGQTTLIKNDNRHFLMSLQALWQYGCVIHWNAYYGCEKRNRVPIPTYPFQRKYYWFDQVIDNKNTIPFNATQRAPLSYYAPAWTRSPELMRKMDLLDIIPNTYQWIIFSDHSFLNDAVIEYLYLNKQVPVIIKKEDAFEAFESIFESKKDRYIILHLWSIEGATYSDGLYSGFYIAQALSRLKVVVDVTWALITTGLHRVIGKESIDPFKSTVLSLCHVLPLEFPSLEVFNIDLDIHDLAEHAQTYASVIVSGVLKRVSSIDFFSTPIHAFRNGYMWSLHYAPCLDLHRLSELPLKLVPQGVYLITGGLGGMGLSIADALSRQVNAITIVLVSRTAFPDVCTWAVTQHETDTSHGIKEKIQQLQRIIQRKTRVIIHSADVADYEAMKRIITDVERTYGDLKGLFHLAGVPGQGLTVSKKWTDIQTVLSPKIEGLFVLVKLLELRKLDFVVCASSLTAIAGGIGQLDYCAANIFLDHYMALKPFQNCQKHLTINWNAWEAVGMAANVTGSKMHQELYKNNSVSMPEAMNILGILLSSDYTHVIVSRFSPEEEVRRIKATFQLEKQEKKTPIIEQQSMMQAYTDVRETVKQMWQQILGVESVTDADNFYALGGDSLLALHLLMQLQHKMNIEIDVADLAYAPTLNALVRLIEYKPIQSKQTIIALRQPSVSLEPTKTIYFIHPLGGTVLCYFPLVQNLHTDYGCYAIQDPELMHQEKVFDSILCMATDYVEQIYIHQRTILKTKAPILLVGASFGGNVAVEMRGLLEKKGVQVEKIVLIDSWAHVSTEGAHELESLRIIRQYYGAHSARYRMIQSRLEWLRNYEPTKVNTPLILLKAKELVPYYESMDKQDNGWQPYCIAITVYAITGTHDTMLKNENAAALGALFISIL